MIPNPSVLHESGLARIEPEIRHAAINVTPLIDVVLVVLIIFTNSMPIVVGEMAATVLRHETVATQVSSDTLQFQEATK